MSWLEMLADPDLARLEYRAESDRWGCLVLSPLAPTCHGGFQAEVGFQLQRLLPAAQCSVECPIRTREGVRLCDLTWASDALRATVPHHPFYERAPEICVEIQAPSDSLEQILERKDWFFEAGALEF